MEFTFICPTDGQVELGLEDISAIIFRSSESIDAVFVCPHCGAPLKASLRVPNFLMAAMEMGSRPDVVEQGSPGERQVKPGPAGGEPVGGGTQIADGRESTSEAYCEYFRRQLDSVESVEDFLAEFEQEG